MTATTTRNLAATTLAATLAFTGLTASAGTMLTDQHDFIHRRMGETTPEARSVGQITGGYGDGGVVRGSGVLVGGRYVLTAAHLVDDMVGGQFTLNGQTYTMNRWVVARDFYAVETDTPTLNPETRLYGNGADLALVELDRRVVGARNLKAKLNTSRKETGKTATIVGYGSAGNGTTGIATSVAATDGTFSQGDGAVWGFQPVKRAGKNIVEPIGPFSAEPFGNNRELVIDFDPAPDELDALAAAGLNPPSRDIFTGEYHLDEDDIPIANEFMPSVGDSGGGLFINGRLAGITSWSTRADSQFFSQAHFTRISVGWWKWVRDNIQAFNRLRADPTLVPWLRVDNINAAGAGFRAVVRIRDQDDFDEDDNTLEVIKIFGPGLFSNPDLDVGQNIDEDTFLVSDILGGADDGAFPNALSLVQYPSSAVPEPATLALLSLGGLAVLRRTRD